MDVENCVRLLEQAGVELEDGLSAREILDIQIDCRFRFPPDLKGLLMRALPVSERFPNWRRGPPESILKQLSWPWEGMCFDIDNHAFWRKEWGERPASNEEACDVARLWVQKAPRLIPVYAHRYIPDRPDEAGNPVFSVYQTDIIHYGRDLSDYLEREFGARRHDLEPVTGPFKHIEFWSDIL